MPDVIVIGGGLLGAACADALAGAGLSVHLLEAGPFARQASWAGAGILHPIHPWSYPAPLHPLLRRAPAEHVRCAAELGERTGLDVELRRTGLLVCGDDLDRLADWCGADPPHRRVEASAEEPAARGAGEALFLPEACNVKSHLLARALLRSAAGRGARLEEHRPVRAIRGDTVETDAGSLHAGSIVLCAGAWADRLRPGLGVEPVRGQILQYRGSLRRMLVFPDGTYAVPRKEGTLLFGSSLERVGFDARPTEEVFGFLRRKAEQWLGLSPSDLLAAWAGLRPGTRNLLPVLGRDEENSRILFACGHYRNGILLAPLTARIVADLARNRQPEFDLEPFRPGGAGST